VHPTLGILRTSQAVFYALSFFWLDGFAVLAPAQVTQTVRRFLATVKLLTRIQITMKPILKSISISLAVGAALTGIISVVLLLGGTFTLIALGNALLYLGVGITILGFAIINFRRTTVDIHLRHQGTQEQKRQKVQTDLADYHVGFSIIFAGLIMATSGWLILDIAICGSLFCK